VFCVGEEHKSSKKSIIVFFNCESNKCVNLLSNKGHFTPFEWSYCRLGFNLRLTLEDDFLLVLYTPVTIISKIKYFRFIY